MVCFFWATLTLVASLLYYLSTVWRRHDEGSGRRLPPGPRALPIIGNGLDLRHGHLHHTLARLARTHGPVMRLQLGPAVQAVVISSRDAAREAFTKHDRRLAARYTPDAVRALGWADRSMVYLPSTEPLWTAQRGIVATHLFAPRSLAVAGSVRERKVRDLVDHLRLRAAAAGRGREEVVVDLGKVLYNGMINLVSNVFFSVDVVDLDDANESAHGIREHVEGLADMMTKLNVSDLFPFLRPLDLQGRRRAAARHLAAIFSIVDGIIDRRLLAGSNSKDDDHDNNSNDFLQVLLNFMSQGQITRDVVKSILFDMFITGGDTVTITVEWAMAELLRNPATMAKVRAEITASSLGGNKTVVDESDAASLPYLRAVVKEVLRMHPVAPVMVPHLAVEDGVEIGGYAVPKGSTVFFNVWAIMRDPAVWNRPDEFLPERFLDGGRAAELDYKGKDYEYIPFGSGRRQCPGLPMVERVVPHMLASLLHAFQWRLPEGRSAEQLDVSERFTTANVLAVPLKAVPVVIT
ncbi:hypothetical protein PR202_ga25673 [Eleusine coracana subsp. coracana]|uniref:Uncharacterized protein n=1 Tax=Eleusine coracana subsp. coracana TaxID=191504 RepID=A0AAV5DAQ8_ELECO|nr:hypothetical protein QOZ80_3AG0249190 [Eleusine coracana subsp. coracana]GJN07809.1 hypothetical protein PR202_ga25673 [Eleusine coracana subsp. coracana]